MNLNFLGLSDYFNIRRKHIKHPNSNSLLVFSQIHGRLVTISMLLSVSVIYLRIDHKWILIFYRKQKNIYREGSGKISKLKNIFLQVTSSTAHHDSNDFFAT